MVFADDTAAFLAARGCAGKSYRPSNGMEGRLFQEAFCELCKADFTGVVPAARMVTVPDGNYPPNLPGTPDSDADEASVGAHGLAVTRWESSDVSDDEEPPRDETAQQERQGSPHSATVADAPSERSP